MTGRKLLTREMVELYTGKLRDTCLHYMDEAAKIETKIRDAMNQEAARWKREVDETNATIKCLATEVAALKAALRCLGYWRGQDKLCFCDPKREGTIHTIPCATALAALEGGAR